MAPDEADLAFIDDTEADPAAVVDFGDDDEQVCGRGGAGREWWLWQGRRWGVCGGTPVCVGRRRAPAPACRLPLSAPAAGRVCRGGGGGGGRG